VRGPRSSRAPRSRTAAPSRFLPTAPLLKIEKFSDELELVDPAVVRSLLHLKDKVIYFLLFNLLV
jgi:hypothetical protein